MQMQKQKNKGFSLPEVMIAMFIFVLIMLVVTSVFVVMVKTRKNAQEMQKNMENIRYAIELMAKNIRMSDVDSPAGVQNELYIYNYSQEKCMHFKFDSGSKKILFGEIKSSGGGGRKNLPNCAGQSYSDKDLVVFNTSNNPVDKVLFDYAPSTASSTLGRVTISIQMAGAQESAQTTVSLRNYSIIK